VDSLKKSYKADRIIIACDKGSSTYRKGIYPEYKANRTKLRETQTVEDKEEFERFFKEFEATMLQIEYGTNYPLLRFQGVEADDIAGYIVSKISEYPINHIWLISSDKDWDLLVSDQVSRFSYVTRKEVTIDNWNNHYDCTPEDYISIKCLMGDSGDNIMGVEGIGPKRAVDLVKEYGSAFDIAASIPINSKYKYIQALNKCKDLLLLNYELMDIITHCEEAIGQDNVATIDEILKEYL
jgi:5'-3' exonuclease